MDCKTTKPTEARCFLCKKSFNISRMGMLALTSHAAGKKHQNKISGKSLSMNISFFSSKSTKGSKNTGSTSKKVKEKASIRSFTINGDTCTFKMLILMIAITRLIIYLPYLAGCVLIVK